eukprot:7312951-Alexandrium_andersonii.AAC.1
MHKRKCANMTSWSSVAESGDPCAGTATAGTPAPYPSACALLGSNRLSCKVGATISEIHSC